MYSCRHSMQYIQYMHSLCNLRVDGLDGGIDDGDDDDRNTDDGDDVGRTQHSKETSRGYVTLVHECRLCERVMNIYYAVELELDV